MRRAKRGTRRVPRAPELSPADLRWTCSPSDASLRGAKGRVESIVGIIGQERAITALKLGIQVDAPGYNVFVCGITGTRRAATVQRILERIRTSCPLPPDRCYVHNAATPDEPRLLILPRGGGTRLEAEMRRFVRDVQDGLAALLESEGHGRKREKIVSRFGHEGDQIMERFERRAEKEGFALKRVREGGVSRPELFPILNGQAVPLSDLETMMLERKVAKRRAAVIVRRHEALRKSLQATARHGRDLLSRMESEISEFERRDVHALVKERAEPIAELFPSPAREQVASYLEEVVEEITAHLDAFRPAAQGAGAEGPPEAAGRPRLEALLGRLKVNVIYEGRKHPECPVIVETHPTYRRLFGYFERTLHPSGIWSTDYTKIRPGSLLRADGGYLVLHAEEVFSQREIWVDLKRSLINRSLAIMDESSGGGVPSVPMRPEPIPINVKVIVIGQKEMYEMLLQIEPDFRKMFKVLADFDEEMERNATTLRQYASFIGQVCADGGLAPLEPAAVAAVAEHGARRAGRQDKLTTRFGEIADLLREADYWRRQEGVARRIRADHVKRAVREAASRAGQVEEKLRDMIRLGQILIEVTGSRVGQLNGLIVQESADRPFGLPARITATVSPGTAGIINIEREAHLSGRTHTKGVLIIGGFLRETFGRRRPVTLTASVALEQSYGGVEGDSASAGEVFAILSALSGAPLRQGIAVTGSVDQKGEIQPVGGINEKIEGFYKVCAIKGLTGDQGVVIPASNRGDLMLSDEVIEAVRRKTFHIHPVRGVSDGLEILTRLPSGTPDALGRHPEGTVLRRAEDRLAEFAEEVRRYGPAGSV